FKPVIVCVDELPIEMLEPGDKVSDSLTLLRGVEGALFSNAGSYTIEVNVSWDLRGGHVSITEQTNVYITSAVDDAHARAAMKIFSTPDTLLSVAITGDHLKEGNEAIEVALGNTILRPHYSYIEAKRLAKPFCKREPDIKGALDLLGDDSILNSTERKKADEIKKIWQG
ncbi:MAG TPA: hypothetical protein VF540_03355, partial [Segetibacter sp.]